MNVEKVGTWVNTEDQQKKAISEKIAQTSEAVAAALEAEAQEKEDRVVIEEKKKWFHNNGFVVKGGFMSERAFEKAVEEAHDLRDQADTAKADAARVKDSLLTPDVFLDQAISYADYMSTDHDLAIADYCGRFPVDKERVSFPFEPYNYTDSADQVEEGGEAAYYYIDEYIKRGTTESDDLIRINDILRLSELKYNDDKKTLDKALASAHVKRVINRENTVALSVLTGAKDAIAVEAASVQTAINNSLCGMAKRNAEIWTNKAGFAALDIDVDGVSLIRRNGNGEFIYKDKYIVREFPSEILPDTDLGSPVLIGDFKNIVRFAVLYNETAVRGGIYPVDMLHREIVEEIPILTTTSDEAYINGYIAAE